jgi:hypothetical protein
MLSLTDSADVFVTFCLSWLSCGVICSFHRFQRLSLFWPIRTGKAPRENQKLYTLSEPSARDAILKYDYNIGRKHICMNVVRRGVLSFTCKRIIYQTFDLDLRTVCSNRYNFRFVNNVGMITICRRDSPDCEKRLLPSCPSVCMEELCSYWTDFDETWYLSLFSKIYLQNSGFIKIRPEWRVLHMKTFWHFRRYVAKFF